MAQPVATLTLLVELFGAPCLRAGRHELGLALTPEWGWTEEGLIPGPKLAELGLLELEAEWTHSRLPR